jgi:replicative DNA helicase
MGIQDTFQLYGSGFQNKLLAVLMKDRIYLQQIHDILDPSYFSSESSQWIAGTIMKYFNSYKSSPTLEVMKVEVDSIENGVLKTTVVDTLKDVMTNIDAPDQQYTKDKSLDFCKNQKLKAAILESVKLLQQGQYDTIKTVVDDAMKAGTDKDIGHEYIDHIEDRFEQNNRKVVPTPWDVVNEIMDGGLGGGEMGVFVAPAGIGKSMALVNAAANCVKKGLNVVYYTLELSDTYVGGRFDSYFTGIPTSDLKYHREEVEQALEKLPGKLVIKYYPTKTASVNTIAAHLDKCALQGIKPDIMFIDYADLLRDAGASKTARHDQVLGGIYEELRGLAGLHQIPLWTASQANRSAAEMEVIEADKIAESYTKVMVADFIVSLSRKTADKISGTGRWHIIKNRFGPDGLTFPSKMNMSVCGIDIFEENTILGQQTKKIMNNDDKVIRNALANKFNELNNLI